MIEDFEPRSLISEPVLSSQCVGEIYNYSLDNLVTSLRITISSQLDP